MYNFFLAFVIFSIFSLQGCSKKESISKGEFGILMEFSQYKGSFEGPNVIDRKVIVGRVIKIAVNNKVDFDNGRYMVVYEILDPWGYFKIAGSGNYVLKREVEKEIASMSMEGFPINNVEEFSNTFVKVIKKMNLPVLLKTVEKGELNSARLN